MSSFLFTRNSIFEFNQLVFVGFSVCFCSGFFVYFFIRSFLTFLLIYIYFFGFIFYFNCIANYPPKKIYRVLVCTLQLSSLILFVVFYCSTYAVDLTIILIGGLVGLVGSDMTDAANTSVEFSSLGHRWDKMSFILYSDRYCFTALSLPQDLQS